MKYIKTRHEIEQLQQGKTYNGLEIIKQADTIEELCDFYVFWIKDREIPIFKRPIKGHRYTEKFWEECYGAIWTDKGLIYVAKLNDKEELELL